jgi:dihydroxyacid dehydratase/phosphogluconate dehydratase
VIVIRYIETEGGPECAKCCPPPPLYGQGMGEKVALITDGRFSARLRASHQPCRAGS